MLGRSPPAGATWLTWRPGFGYAPTPTEPHYVATKAAVIALSRCLRADWADAGVNVVCPGINDTPTAQRTRFLGREAASEA